MKKELNEYSHFLSVVKWFGQNSPCFGHLNLEKLEVRSIHCDVWSTFTGRSVISIFGSVNYWKTSVNFSKTLVNSAKTSVNFQKSSDICYGQLKK
ncbi:hypothetical protein [Sutcliffiella horikoshii]|uniref:hypothetical protein n=1 Tax=Sutcliffiella horikoshii TaxID=79883 RepID=UPI0012FCF127|nr:hypothetical protein [Sutcliffiella horikoshii]